MQYTHTDTHTQTHLSLFWSLSVCLSVCLCLFPLLSGSLWLSLALSGSLWLSSSPLYMHRPTHHCELEERAREPGEDVVKLVEAPAIKPTPLALHRRVKALRIQQRCST